MNILADIAPVGMGQVGTWVVIAVGALNALVALRLLTAKQEPLPQPLRTREMETFATREELEKVEAGLNARAVRLEEALDNIREEMKSDRQDILDAGEKRAANIHERLNALGQHIDSQFKEIAHEIGEIVGELKEKSK